MGGLDRDESNREDQMRAAVLSEDHVFRVATVPDPIPHTGELVLRVRSCGICGSDLKSYVHFGAGSILGHEFCGEVSAIGSDVEGNWRDGQLVTAMPLSSCGRCRWCLGDEPAHCEQVDVYGLGGSAGAFAEFVRVSAATAVPLEDDLGDFGALVEPLAVGLHSAAIGEVRPGDRVLVLGGGTVGVAVAVWARRLGAREVIISDPAASRRADVDRFGATGAHDPNDGPLSPRFDVVFECVGLPGMIQAAVDAAVVRGRVVVAGVCMVPDEIVPVAAVLKEVQVRFAIYYRQSEFRAAADLIATGGLDTRSFVTQRVGLDGVQAVFQELLTSTTDRKVLVTP